MDLSNPTIDKGITTKSLNKQETPMVMAVYHCSLDDVSKIDLSFLNLKFASINSEDFKIFLKNTEMSDFPLKNFNYYNNLGKQFSKFKLFVLYPIDLAIKIDVNIYFEIQNFLLGMYLPDFKLVHVTDFQLFEEKYLCYTGENS